MLRPCAARDSGDAAPAARPVRRARPRRGRRALPRRDGLHDALAWHGPPASRWRTRTTDSPNV